MMTKPLSTAREADHGGPTSISRNLSLVLAALIPLALAAGPAFGDAAAGPASAPAGAKPESGELQEVLITAEKRVETVQETPISVSALTSTDLLSKNIESLEDVARSVPGLSTRTAGPGQTEYEMRGLTSAGGSTATVGFYIDETPLSASAVALNGRTVIDPDLYDLNHVEVLRGPQGTLYGAGSMGGTIKLVTNPPQLQKWAFSTDVFGSHTDSGGSWNGGGSFMLNIPMGDIVALRAVGTAKYISGWIQRVVIPPADFPYPTGLYGTAGTPSVCVYYYCNRGDVQDATSSKIIRGSNQERFQSARLALLVKPNEKLSVTFNGMYERIDADGYNNYQATGDVPGPYPSHPGIYQPYDQPEPYYDQFKMISMNLVWDLGPTTMTLAPSYWQRFVYQSTDSTEALQNINNLTSFVQNLYVETDPTTQDSIELRFASNGEHRWQWQFGGYGADLHSGYITYNQEPGFATATQCPFAGPLGGHCAQTWTHAPLPYDPNSNLCQLSSGDQPCNFNGFLRFPDPTLPPYPNRVAANPNGVVFNDNNPNVMKQWAIFGEAGFKLLEDLKLTAGIRYFSYKIENHADQAGVGTQSLNQDHTILDTSQTGSATLPKLNLSYTPTPDLTLYGTVAKGSRPGGVNLPIPIPSIQQLQANPAAYNCNLPLANQLNPSLPRPPGAYVSEQPGFGPDSVWSYELGEKARLADNRFVINGDIYYIKWTDIQQVVSLTCGYPANINAGNARAYGPELETATRITDAWTFDLSAAYTKAEINNPNPTAQAAGFYPGILIINVPKYEVIASLDWHQSINDKLTGVFHVASSLTGPIQDQAYYRETLPSHNLVDARFGVTSERWGAYLFGTNLTNKVAALTINNTIFAWQQPTITRVSTNQPRTIGMEFSYGF
jgi:outer membrane receptor protein involved in Fe transport